MSPKRKKRKERERRQTRKSFLATPNKRQIDSQARSWPVVRAYVPLYEAWHATGFGTAGIIRQRPDGKLSTAYFPISFVHGGIESMTGKDDVNSLEDELGFQAKLKFHMPPMQEGSPDAVAQYVWGAYAWSDELGYGFPPEESAPYLALVPRLGGTRNWWLQQFMQEPLSPTKLAHMLWDNPMPDEVPDDKEIVIFTTMNFDLDDHATALDRLSKLKDELRIIEEDGDEIILGWSRKYPKNHWNPLSLLGGRQSLGTVTITPGKLTAEVNALSMGAILVEKLKDQLGASMRFKNAQWIDPRTMPLDTDKPD